MKSRLHVLSPTHLRLKETARLLALAGLLSLGGCGGDGGDTVAGAPAGGVVVVAGGVGAAGAAGAAAKSAAVPDAVVEVGVYKADDTRVDLQTVISNAVGGYELTLNDPNGDLASGGYVVVNVRRDGFADYSTRVDFTSRPETIRIPDAELSGVITSVDNVGDKITASASNGSFIMGIVRMRDGSRKAMAGKQYLAAKAAGEDPDMEIEIPAATLSGVTSIRAQLQTFDSSDPDDARRFPGSYTDSRNDAQGRPIRIVSLGFDYMNLADDSGQNIGAAAKAARVARGLRKAAIDWRNPTVVTRWLPQGSLNNLLQDACNDNDPLKADIVIPDNTSDCAAMRKAYDDGSPTRDELLGDEARDGFQVPIYTYDPNTGRWDLFGIGTLVRNYNGDASSMVTWAQVGDHNNDGSINTADFRSYAAANQLNVRIYVTNENFQRQYWNLDYPLVFTDPVELCIQGKMYRTDKENEAVAGQYLTFSDNDAVQTFSYGSGSTNANGDYKITVLLQSDASDSTERDGKLGYYDRFNEEWKEIDPATLGVSPNCTTRNISITPPVQATVQGRVVDDLGAPKSGQSVYGYGGNRRFSATSGSDGRFSAEIRQGAEYDVYVSNGFTSIGKFMANNTVANLENQDNNTLVVLNDIVLANRAPYAYGYAYTRSMRLRGSDTTATTQLYLYGADSDADYPIAWQVLNGATCNADGSFSGGNATGLTGSFTGNLAANGNATANNADPVITLPQGNHALVLALTDNASKQGCTSLGTVTVSPPLANRKPNVYWLVADNSRYDKGASMTFIGTAWDPDGDNLTATWSTQPSGLLLGEGCNVALVNGSATCTITAPNADTLVTVTLTVSDDALTDARSTNVQVGTAPSNVDVTVR